MAAQNVRHVEIFFDPQGHTGRGVAFDTVMSGLTDALDRAQREFGITSKLIMCFLRHLSEEQAFDTLREACRCKEHIFGVGLDSTENGNPPSKFARVFAARGRRASCRSPMPARKGPPAYVCEAIDILQGRAHRPRQPRAGGSRAGRPDRARADPADGLPAVQQAPAVVPGPARSIRCGGC